MGLVAECRHIALVGQPGLVYTAQLEDSLETPTRRCTSTKYVLSCCAYVQVWETGVLSCSVLSLNAKLIKNVECKDFAQTH